MNCILLSRYYICFIGVLTAGLAVMAVTTADNNVAINKPTHQENPAVLYDDRFASSNAVDGLKANHTYNEGQCVLSAYGKQTATWWVNLTSIHSIHHITIFFRTGNEKSGFDQPLTITVSPKYLRLKEGVQALFRCQSSLPVPLRWRANNNRSLPQQASVGDNFLEIPETRISDSGSYKCFVVGEESRFFAVAKLDILTAGSTCGPYTITCSNGKCVPISYICDGDNDCGDFSDERNCAGSTCGPDQMMCPNGKCVPISFICDGVNDCGDFSDERNCQIISYMPSNFLGFSVYVSNTTDRSQGTLCFQDNNFTTSSLPSVFTINCSVHGQYVIYYNERLTGTSYPDEYSMYAFNDVCEVEVYVLPSEDNVNYWQIMFYCILAGFFVSLIINGILIRERQLKKQRTKNVAQWTNGELLNVPHNCNVYENLQQPPTVDLYETVI